jgi:hypothetical protein
VVNADDGSTLTYVWFFEAMDQPPSPTPVP